MDKAFLCFKCSKEPKGHILQDGGFWVSSCFHVFCTACNALGEEQKKCILCKKPCKSVAVNTSMDLKLKELFMPLDMFFKDRVKKLNDKLKFQEELRRHYIRGFNKKKAEFAKALEYCKKSSQVTKGQNEEIENLKGQLQTMNKNLKKNEVELKDARQKISDYEDQLSKRVSSNCHGDQWRHDLETESTMEDLFKRPYAHNDGGGSSLNMSSFFPPSQQMDDINPNQRSSSRDSLFPTMEGSTAEADNLFQSDSQMTEENFAMGSQTDGLSFRLCSPAVSDLSMQSEMTTPKLLGMKKRVDDSPMDPVFKRTPTGHSFLSLMNMGRSSSRRTPGAPGSSRRPSRSPGLQLGASASSSRRQPSPGSSLGFNPGPITLSSIIPKNNL